MPLELGDGCNFVTGLKTLMASGSPLGKDGLSISMYAFSQDMVDTHFYNSDGDFLIVPQYGSLLIYTELGRLIVHPKEICVIPRGIVFSVHQHDSSADVVARGYVLEVSLSTTGTRTDWRQWTRQRTRFHASHGMVRFRQA